jgi:hypothetical protein
MIALIPRGSGNTGPPPPWLIPFIVALLGSIFLFVVIVIVRSLRSEKRRRARIAAARAGGRRAHARVILLERSNSGGDVYTITVEVAVQPPFVTRTIAEVPLAQVPQVQVGATVPVCYDPADPPVVGIELPGVSTLY